MSARNTILDNIRQRTKTLNRQSDSPAQPRLPEAQYADNSTTNLTDRFICKVETVHGSVEKVEHQSMVSEAVKQYLMSQSLPLDIVISPLMDSLELGVNELSTELSTASRPAIESDTASLTWARAGIAETGTLVLVSSSLSPVSLNFLPETNIVLLKENNIVLTLESWFDKQLETVKDSRAVNLITGVSKTADIEQTIVYGAHGPRRLHVIIIQST